MSKNKVKYMTKSEQSQMGIDLLKCAEDDSRACCLLHNDGLYALAIYHLQQGVEKASKAYALKMAILNDSQVNLHDHNSVKKVLAATDNSSVVDKPFPIGPSTSRIGFNVGDKSRELSRLKREDSGVDRWSEQEIRAFIRASDLVSERLTLAYQVDLTNLLLKAKTEEKRQQILYRLNTISKGFYLDGFFEYAPLITDPHNFSTRYPDVDSMKPSEYNMDLGIVRMTPEINERLINSIDTLKESLEYSRKIYSGIKHNALTA